MPDETSGNATEPQPLSLDADQVARIEAVHKGFLYQHLFGVACLQLGGASGLRELVSEGDEDVELVFDDVRVYVQVKTRGAPLIWSDIKGAVERFSKIRETHRAGERAGEARFLIASSSRPGPKLDQRLNGRDWPEDVSVLWPGSDHSDGAVPEPWSDVNAALEWCTAFASKVPYSKLAPETLVLKLATIVQLAAGGVPPRQDHAIRSEELPTLFEQLILQLQHFPSTPDPYWPHEEPPSIDLTERVHLITGLPGSGKTAWIAQTAILDPGAGLYFDVGDTQGQELPGALARAMAAQWLPESAGALGSIFLPGATGLEMLRATDLQLRDLGQQLTVFVDNIHKVSATDIAAVVGRSETARFVLTAQPGAMVTEFEARLGLRSQNLNGWSLSTIAAVFSTQGLSLSPRASERVRHITAGLPLFVSSAATVTREQYGGDVDAFCTAIDTASNTATTPQELILGRLIETLADSTQAVAGLLSLSDVPLALEEVHQFIGEALGASVQDVAASIRDLEGAGMARRRGDGMIVLHEAVSAIVGDVRASLGNAVVSSARIALRDLLEASVSTTHSLDRTRLFLRLLPQTGATDTLIELSTDEFFHEFGIGPTFDAVLREVADDTGQEPKERFWALDALAWLDYQSDDLEGFESKVALLERLASDADLGITERSTLEIRKISLAGLRGNRDEAIRLSRGAFAVTEFGSEEYLVTEYTLALALFHCEDYAGAEKRAQGLVNAYYRRIGLSPAAVLAMNVPKMRSMLPDATAQSDLKHLADSLYLFASARRRQDLRSGVSWITAMKFYELAGALRSIVKTGLEVADEEISLLQDADEAIAFLTKSLLPAIEKYRLFDHVVPVRALLAVAFAYAGRYADAFTEIEQLSPFAEALTAYQQAELANQTQLVKEIAARGVRLVPVDLPLKNALARGASEAEP